MKDEQSASKGNPIIIASTGMRIAVDYRRGIGGDEGLTFNVTAVGENEEREFCASTVSGTRHITTSAPLPILQFTI
jgi:hypothetical protein